MTWIFRRHFYHIFRPGKTCGKFVPDHKASLPGIYCRVCGFDIDVHRRIQKVAELGDFA